MLAFWLLAAQDTCDKSRVGILVKPSHNNYSLVEMLSSRDNTALYWKRFHGDLEISDEQELIHFQFSIS